MDKEQIKKAFDEFEDENYIDAEETLKSQLKQAKNDFLKDKLDLENDVEEIEAEDKSHPLSDSKLAQLFVDKYGLDISRRTVAKYRKSLGIKSSRQRKKK